MSGSFDDLVDDLQDQCDQAAEARFGPAMVARWKNPTYVGEMPTPSASATTKGACDDDITIYLKIRDNLIEKASFYANGCGTGVVCGDACAELAQGRTLEEALQISGEDIIERIGGLPKDKRKTAHSTAAALKKALTDYKAS
jgi:nitrogen fixation protein NifU and related proteins